MASWIENPSLAAAILTTGLPFISFALILVVTRNHRRLSAAIALTAAAASLAGG